jgi:adenylyl- and sulfurtransferase ThiI
MQLAKKSINKLSEVIGIKSILTAMNIESESDSDDDE